MKLLKSVATTLAAAVTAALTFASPLAIAFDLGGLVDKKMLDQAARDKLGMKTDTANPSDTSIPLTGNPSTYNAVGRTSRMSASSSLAPPATPGPWIKSAPSGPLRHVPEGRDVDFSPRFRSARLSRSMPETGSIP